jgi:hypothetical protein
LAAARAASGVAAVLVRGRRVVALGIWDNWRITAVNRTWRFGRFIARRFLRRVIDLAGLCTVWEFLLQMPSLLIKRWKHAVIERPGEIHMKYEPLSRSAKSELAAQCEGSDLGLHFNLTCRAHEAGSHRSLH